MKIKALKKTKNFLALNRACGPKTVYCVFCPLNYNFSAVLQVEVKYSVCKTCCWLFIFLQTIISVLQSIQHISDVRFAGTDANKYIFVA